MTMYLERNLKYLRFCVKSTNNMTVETELTDNQKAFQSWLNITESERPQFVAFVDGDLVEEGDNFQVLAINASQFKTLRGTGAQMDVYDARSKEKIPV